VNFDDVMNKNVYKICKIVLSENDVDFSEELDDEQILEDYEICEMFENTLSDVKKKIIIKQKDLEDLLYRIENLGKTIENLNLLTDINEYLVGGENILSESN
jgi:phosphatidate phosphatase PAH1